MKNLDTWLENAAQGVYEKDSTSVEAAQIRRNTVGDAAENFIPKGGACYQNLKVMPNENPNSIPTLKTISLCPFWASDPSKEDQMSGYCTHIKAGDWQDNGTILLWDLIKECGLNDDMEEPA